MISIRLDNCGILLQANLPCNALSSVLFFTEPSYHQGVVKTSHLELRGAGLNPQNIEASPRRSSFAYQMHIHPLPKEKRHIKGNQVREMPAVSLIKKKMALFFLF